MFAPKEAESKSGAGGGALSKLTTAAARDPARQDTAANQPETRVRERSADLSWNFSRIPVFPGAPADQPRPSTPAGRAKFLQPKLLVGSVSDPLESEADAAADRVMQTTGPASPSDAPGTRPHVQRKCGAACQCEACRGEKEDEESPRLARAESTHGADFDHTAAPEIVGDVLRSPGHALDQEARTFFEARFRRDFQDVRIHADPRAGESARAVGALAYTVGRDIVFGSDQYKPGTSSGRRLLAHELAHVEQQRNGRPSSAEHIFRQVDPEEEERKKRAAEEEERKKRAAAKDEQQTDAGGAAEGAAKTAPTAPTQTTAEAKPAGDPAKQAEGSAAPVEKTDDKKTSSAAAPTVTPGGHSAAPAGMAECPDAPLVNVVVVGCPAAPAAAPPAEETVELPKPNPARFGGDADRAKFAKELAQCRAARVVKDTVEKRYRDAVKAAKAQATEEAKHDTEEALKSATEGVDPKDRRAIAKAKADATAAAKKAAAKKVADAEAAVKREDVAAVTAELAAAFEQNLADDYDKTIDALMKTYGPGWLKSQQAARKAKRAQVTKEKNAKPKVKKGEEAPPPKSAEEISAAIEEDMAPFRCDQKQWVLQQIENVAHAWAVGRREQVDFDTREKNKYLKDFDPTYKPRPQDLVPLVDPKTQQTFPGVAPEMNDFLNQLHADPAAPPFRAENYGGHGGGSWAGMGFSVDLYLTNAPTDQRGFWRHEDAVKFLLRLDANAKALSARWRVLYNDFRVADEVNTTTGARNVGFMGGLDAKGSLNWHGPEGLKLHFHLDLEIPKKTPAPAAPTTPTTPASTP